MKNKKTIAIATAAMSVATVVPAFADTPGINFEVTTGHLDLNIVNGTKLVDGDNYTNNGTQAFSKEDAELYLKRNKNAKIVGSKLVDKNDNRSYYIVKDIDSSSNDVTKAAAKEELARIKNVLNQAENATYSSNGKTYKRYTIGKTLTEYSVDTDNAFRVLPSVLKIEVRDNIDGTIVKTIELYNVDTDYQVETEVEVKRIEINKNQKGAKLKLNKALYELKKELKANSKLVYKVAERVEDPYLNPHVIGYNIEIWDEAQMVKYGEILTNMSMEELKAAYINVPVGNDFMDHWAENDIVEQMILGPISLSSTFRPQEYITRADFAKILYQNYKKEIKDRYNPHIAHIFTDVAKGSYYAEAVEHLAAAGIINGYGDGTFKPNSPITREEAAKIIATLISDGDTILGTDADGNAIHKDVVTRFADDKDISVWADESVEALHNGKIIKGYEDNTFRPKENIRRGEAAAIINRTLN